MRKRLGFATNDQMNMARHDALRIYIEPFIALAVLQTIQYNLTVFIPYKYIYPVNNGKRNKEEFRVMVELVFSAHVCRKISFGNGGQ